ncbi:MAG: mechanosensitive ion channel protein MscS [Betaproteobacteria bacterium]|nr:MAG: mechanosensitive ion channel protein MscS [Betaproteobacteria bacterium]
MKQPFTNLLERAWIDLHDPQVAWQIAILLACFLLAWAAGRVLRLSRVETDGIWKFGVGGLRRILFPVVALIPLTLSIGLLKFWSWIEVDLLRLFVPLLLSLLLVRLFFYLLRHVFAQGSIVRTFERAIAALVWGGLVLHVSGLLPDAIGLLDDITFKLGTQKLTLWLVLQGLFWVVITLLAAMWLSGTIEARLMRAESLHTSLRVVFSRLATALLVLLAVLLVLPLLGIDLTVLSLFGGAIGVGLGFGLQKIASNYVSGFIILLDRSIRIGDLITVDNFYGEVKNITTRYVVVRSLDGREAIIPNELLITTTVLNHSYSNRQIRLALDLQIAYRSDLQLAMKLMEEAASRHPRALADPPPKSVLLRFADSGIDLELGVWIEDPENGVLSIRSELFLDIWRAFQEAGIEIPFPQREVRILGDAGSAPA